MYIFTLQGPTVDGNHLLESWEITYEMFAQLRAKLEGDPMATTLTDPNGKVISQRFGED